MLKNDKVGSERRLPIPKDHIGLSGQRVTTARDPTKPLSSLLDHNALLTRICAVSRFQSVRKFIRGNRLGTASRITIIGKQVPKCQYFSTNVCVLVLSGSPTRGSFSLIMCKIPFSVTNGRMQLESHK